MSSPGVLDGTRPYRFLDETSVSNGYVRLRALLLLPALLVLLAGLILGYELGSPVEDRDARDAAWDYRTTATQSTAFHAYFRAAYWPSYKAMDINPEVYREVVVAARDRPVVLALHPPDALCLRAVTVPCLAARPSHRDEDADGPLNLGTDAGAWAVGNGRVFKRDNAGTNLGLLSDGVASVDVAYANAADLASYYVSRYDELDDMRVKAVATLTAASGGGTVATVNGLDCPSDASGVTCAWTEAQWLTWAGLAFTDLGSATCDATIDVCSQTRAALEQAAQSATAVGKVAVRVLTGSWVATNPHLSALAVNLPKVAAVTHSGVASDALAELTSPAPWFPLTDAAGADSTGYVDPATAAALVDAAAGLTGGDALTGYVAPPDDDAKLHGLRGGVVVGGSRADLETSFETSSTWRTRRAYLPPLYDVGFWPWPGQCPGTGHNVTVATDEELYVYNYPAFDARGDAPTIAVVVLGRTFRVAAYSSACDFDAADAGAGGDAVRCSATRLAEVEVRVAFTPVAGEAFGGWRAVSAVGTYFDASDPGTAAAEVCAGTENECVAAFAGGSTRTVRVVMRDAGAPERFRSPPLGTPGKMYAAIGLFVAALFVAPIQPYLMVRFVYYNVAMNKGQPPPGWQAMPRFRGW